MGRFFNKNAWFILISKLSKEFNDMNYNIDSIFDLNDYNIGKDTDIILSFDLNYKKVLIKANCIGFLSITVLLNCIGL